MVRRWKASKLFLLLLSFTLVIVAGCQAVGGLNLNQVLMNSLKVTSSESKQTIEFQLNLDEDAMAFYETDEMNPVIELLSKIKLELRDVKIQDSSHLSLNGNLLFGDNKGLDFALRLSDTMMEMELEGAKQPFMIDLSGDALASRYGIDVTEAGNVSEESMAELGMNIMDIVGGYAIDNLPNPDRLTASPVFEPVNGVNTSMIHVHAEMNGLEMWEWLGKYVDALLTDQDGLEEALTGIIEVLGANEELWEAIGEVNPFQTGELDAPTNEEMVEEAATAITDMLTELRTELDMAEDDSEFAAEKDALKEAVNVTSDLYVDGKLNIRKEQFELNFSMAPIEEAETAQAGDQAEDYFEFMDSYENPSSPMKGFTLKFSKEQWNVNGEVEAEAPIVPEDAIGIEELENRQGYQMLKLFEEDSFIYDLLKNKMHITKQTYSAYSDDYYNPPIVTPEGITIVPLRDLTDAFGATIEYDPETRSIEVYDEATDTTILMQIGSDKVIINGVEELWPTEVTLVESTAYVPARKLAEALGASIEWQTLYEDWKMLNIEREL
ncbi:copper amine oxidase N-terminal domain-containing protein [Paenibacillus sp. HB172176]|uniref:copper amine oxidase N-terminal domain-containing protein n=1 Tax=Paenibacillus sp. HB172176 TaxID=2493690 RepID=UPI00143ACC7C|nr:copper amine oxidase N-terminal domain-containing protein [Paenibacillus sp. HB172176]